MATRIKRYEARLQQLDELLARIEAEMGPDAELETRQFRRQRLLGLFGGERMVEVIAIVEIGAAANKDAPAVRQQAPARSAPPPAGQRESPPAAREARHVSPPAAGRAQPAAVPDQAPRDTPQPARPVDTAAAPPAGRPRRIDVTADAPTQFEPAAPSATAEARITADAQRFAMQAAAAEELKRRQQALFEARTTPRPADPRPQQPPRSTIPAMQLPSEDTQESSPEADPQRPAAAPAPGAESTSEIGELRDTIADLRATVELLAATQQSGPGSEDQPAQPPPAQPAPAAGDASLRAETGAAAVPEQRVEGTTSQPAAAAPAADSAPQPAAGRVTKSDVADPMVLDHSMGLPEKHRRVYDQLLDWNIGPYDALELLNAALQQCADAATATQDQLLQAVFREICRSILLSEGIQLGQAPPGKAVALVGATGVGKTTTIAKLAASFAFQQGRRVSLVSLDNYRIAAAEQLRTYADIMGLSLDIVFSREEFDQVLTQRRSNDLVLIDTAGRSPLNSQQIYELREIFAGHPPDEVHLVVSASTKADDVRMLLENFAPLAFDHVIVSKLDETHSLGCLYNLIKHCQLPISYFTVGQSVPEDIRTANLEFVRTWIGQGRIS